MSRITKRIFVTFALLLLAAAFTGCGSGNKEGATPAGADEVGGVAKVDEALCIGCHSSWAEPLSGDPIVANYQASVHALNSVGCQDCHGGGAMHNGVGPIPYPNPNHEQCARCHNSDGLVTAYTESKHYNVVIEESSVCNRCHTHQGAVLGAKAGFTGDGEALDTTLASLAPGDLTAGTGEPIKCNTCHVTHKPEQLRVDTTWAPSTMVGSVSNTGNNQYKLCTQCHTYINPAGVLAGSGTTTPNGLVTVEVGHHNTSWYRAIPTTHYDNPATTSVVEGYVLRTNGTNPCFDCHNHESKTNTRTAGTTLAGTTLADATIYSDWSQSGHAGGLLTIKYEAAAPYSRSVEQVNAVMDAGVDEAAGAAWVHYNWDQTTGTNNRATCQRCHTSTGASNYLTNPTTYDPTNNDFSHLSGWTAATGSNQNELLYCWGCHSNAGKGVVRNPGAFTASYMFNGTAAVFPDVAESNTCITCHTGLESGESLDSIADFSNASFKNSHYMAAAGLMYVK
ncbi:MAG: cytochrome C, partial [Geobacteraceae bacterium]|nr:cytochrome C [Geobacteraceae bacterium]